MCSPVRLSVTASSIGWETLLLDTGSAVPRVVQVYPEILDGFPVYAPRVTGGWYEIVRNPWNGFADFFIAAPDGTRRHVLRDERDHDLPVAVGRGGLATVAEKYGPRPEVVFWYDTTIGGPRITAP